MPSGHSTRGASSMYRWQNCPGSVKLSENMESKSSYYAAEGTVAHHLGEKCLENGWLPKRFLGETFKQDGFDIEVTQDMVDAVSEYVAYVREKIGSTPASKDWAIEHKFHIKELHESLFGTADFTLFDKKTGLLEVIDYKHGAGIPVEVVDNPQLLYYGLGAVRSGRFTGVKELKLTIVQPRCPHPDGPARSWDVDIVDLIDWEADLLDAVAATEADTPPLRMGKWCRFCPAAAVCPEAVDKANELAEREFGPQQAYDPAELSKALEWADIMKVWAQRVHEFAYQEAEQGHVPPGYKLVEKQARRYWIDPDPVVATLKEQGYEEFDIYKMDLKSPAQIEKLLGKKNKDLVADYIEKRSNGHTLAPESDSREPVKESAEQAFSPVSSSQ